MNIIEFATPAPSCVLPALHPSRAHVPAVNTDVRRTFMEHSYFDLIDDYERTDAQGYLEQLGAFK